MTESTDNTLTPTIARTPDTGSKVAGRVAWAVGALAFIALVCLRQGAFEPSAPPPAPGIAAPGLADPVATTAKLIVKLSKVLAPPGSADAAALVGYVDTGSKNPLDQFRVAIVELELAGQDPALSRLRSIDPNLADGGKRYLSPEDAATLSTHRDLAIRAIERGSTTLTDQERQSLRSAHGYFADLLFALDLPDSDPARAPLISGGGWILFLLFAAFAVLGAYAIAGLVMMILFFVRLGSGRIVRTFTPPVPGGSVYIETVAIFVAGFLALQVIVALLPKELAPSENVHLLMQWVFLVVPFWPLLRGVPFSDLRQQIGLHAPRGVAREIGSGIFAYFAALPFLGIAFLITAMYVVFRQRLDPGAPPPSNPMQEMVGQSGPLTLVLFFTLATIWAPLVEEMIFRGAFYRHLRGRIGMVLSAVISALVFGLMHGYPLPLLVPVITLGFFFALMREWRGSLISSMTAHFIHNFTLLTFAIAFFQAIK